MTDLQTRFQTLDDLQAPEMWREIEARAQAKEPRVTRTLSWVLVGVGVMLALVVGAAFLVGSGMVKLSSTAPTQTATTTSSVPVNTATSTAHAAEWIVAGSMLEARTDHTATLLPDGRVLVAGGFNGSKKLASAELFDPNSRSWTATGSMNEARSNHSATLMADGRVLVVSGEMVFGSRYPGTKHAELYDPDTGTWTATGDVRFLYSSNLTALTLLADGKVLLVPDGGDSWVYDPGTSTWGATKRMVEDRSDYAATRLLDGTVLVAGGCCGSGPQYLASAELFDPASRTWTATGSMRAPRALGAATLLLDGRVLVAGGHGGHDAMQPDLLDSAELFDPASGVWTATGNMDMARGRFGTFTLLQDGTVLAAGGAAHGGATAAAELYDPVRGMWTATASMSGARADHTATLLADGTILVVGGYASADLSDPIPTAIAEMYDPAAEN
jgi:N-acetylneuraminic acid mutarotase